MKIIRSLSYTHGLSKNCKKYPEVGNTSEIKLKLDFECASTYTTHPSQLITL